MGRRTHRLLQILPDTPALTAPPAGAPPAEEDGTRVSKPANAAPAAARAEAEPSLPSPSSPGTPPLPPTETIEELEPLDAPESPSLALQRRGHAAPVLVAVTPDRATAVERTVAPDSEVRRTRHLALLAKANHALQRAIAAPDDADEDEEEGADKLAEASTVAVAGDDLSERADTPAPPTPAEPAAGAGPADGDASELDRSVAALELGRGRRARLLAAIAAVDKDDAPTGTAGTASAPSGTAVALPAAAASAIPATAAAVLPAAVAPSEAALAAAPTSADPAAAGSPQAPEHLGLNRRARLLQALQQLDSDADKA